MDAGAGGLLRYRPQHPGGAALVDLQRHPAERRPDGPHRAPAPGGPGAAMTGVVIGLLVALSALRVPFGSAPIAAVLVALLAGGGTTPAVIPLHLFSGAAKFPLLAIPLFILAGGIMSSAGISLRIINMASTLVGHIRGGLGMVNVASSMFFAEISGSAVADVAAIGSIIMPAMVQKGYPPAFTAGLTSVAASLAIIIPTSIPMILYAGMAGTSVTRLFLTGFAPGVIGGLLMMVVVYYKARRLGFPVERAFAARRVVTGIREAGWTVLLPVIILGGMFGGIVTATEAAGLAVLAAFIIGTFIYREMDFRQLRALTLDGVVQTATVMLIVAASAVLGWYLTNEQVPQRFAAAVLGLTSNPTIVRSEEHTSELQSPVHIVCRLLLEKKKTRHDPFRSRRRGHQDRKAGRRGDPQIRADGARPERLFLGLQPRQEEPLPRHANRARQGDLRRPGADRRHGAAELPARGHGKDGLRL